MTSTIEEAFARAQEVTASSHDLAGSLAIIIWREMNNWQWSPHRTDGDFIKFHASCKRCQDEIKIMTNGIRLILDTERRQPVNLQWHDNWNKVMKALAELYRVWNFPEYKRDEWVQDRLEKLIKAYDEWLD